MADAGFHTFREYMGERELSASMEDYLEMICRLSSGNGYTRVHTLAGALHVQPPAASRMVRRLAEAGFVEARRYGVIVPLSPGWELGGQLLQRHAVLTEFLQFLGLPAEQLLLETEMMEHTLTPATMPYIARFVRFCQADPEFCRRLRQFESPEGPAPVSG